MRIEILFALITGAIAYNIYSEGKFLKQLLTYKKYYQIGGIIFAALSLYWLIKKNPDNARNIIMTGNEYIKYLPIDSTTTSFITPILDMTTKSMTGGGGSISDTWGEGSGYIGSHPIVKVNESVRATTSRRNVSETKKKFIAYNQSWKCNHCNSILNHTYEIDHKIRLEYGGSNDVSNLEALCRNCHGQKTANENMGILGGI